MATPGEAVTKSVAKNGGLAVATSVACVGALLIASPLGMIGSQALCFLVPYGWPAPFRATGFVLFPLWILAAHALPVILGAAAIGYRRIEIAAAALGVVLLMWGTFDPARQLVRMSIHRGLSTVAVSASPVIDALEEYRSKNGGYPEKLDALVPSYLPRIPTTGLAAYPQYWYHRSKGSQPPKGYELSVPVSTGVLDFSAFQYWPEGDYPPTWPHQSPEVVGDWAIWYD